MCTGCLYLPKSFINGGWLFSCFCLTFSAIFTCYCAILLIETREKLKCTSFSQVGYLAYGPKGKYLTDLSLVLSQMGFCVAYVYFVKENLHNILLESLGVNISSNWFAFISFFIYTALCLVRRIEFFAKTHVFADVIIAITLLSVFVYGAIELSHNGPQIGSSARLGAVYLINPVTWSDGIGFSVYAFEGIAVILPIRDIT